MHITVVGLGMGGAALACLLADRGHDVLVVEQEADPRPVGAGIWLQAMGQQVLERLGVLDDLRARSVEVDRIDMRRADGRPVLQLAYDEVPGEMPALGVHRGDLFDLLHAAVRARGVPIEVGRRIERIGDLDTDLVVGADGSRSAVREAIGVTRRDHPYAYGALWSIVDDPDGLSAGTLFQCMRGTREYLGVLPTGRGRASIFWSVRTDQIDEVIGRGIDTWRTEARPLAHHLGQLVDRVDHLLPARYRDVVVRQTHRFGSPSAVLIGDAAHAMSPQLGTGTSLALADAWTLAWALETATSRAQDLDTALRRYESARRAHVRWYQWWTRLMMPAFQSGATPLAYPRDLLAPVIARVPGVRPILVTTLTGDHVGPRSRWSLPPSAAPVSDIPRAEPT